VTKILVIDNYDSFVYTIVGYLNQLGAETVVVRNDAVPPVEERTGFDGVSTAAWQSMHLYVVW